MFWKKQRQIEGLESALRFKDQLFALAIQLAEGCARHPSYRGIRKATSSCGVCGRVHDSRVKLNLAGYAMRSGKRGPGKPKSSRCFDADWYGDI